MRTRNIISLLAILLLTSLGMQAQNNTLSTPNVTLAAGNETVLPIYLDNTTDVVAVQFNLSLPVGLYIPRESIVTDRTSSHTVSGNEMYVDDFRHYTIILMSADNSVITGRSGAIINIPLFAEEDLPEGTVLQPIFSDVIIATRDGSNVATGYSNGTITISPGPDLVVKNVTTDATSITPGENIAVNWTVENIGTLATSAGWSEHIYLMNEDETYETHLVTVTHDGILDAGGIESRQAEISVPFFIGVDGNAHVRVRISPYSDCGESLSARENNTATSLNTIYISKKLNIEFSPNKANEDYAGRIAFFLSRSGSWNKSETFDISTTIDERVTLPSKITIPANQSGTTEYFNIKNNDTFDNDSIVSVAVRNPEYPDAKATFILVDDEKRALSVSASKDDVNEGESFQMTVSLGSKAALPINVTLTCEHPGRFSFTREAIIPTGEDHVSFDITAIDNNDIELDETIAFRASAEGHENAECLITLYDNDLPTLEFSVTPSIISEADGYNASFGRIKRTDNLNKRVTLKLSDDAEGLLIYPTNTIVLERNQSEAQFNIGVIDNQVVDGDRTVTITASVYVASCGCSASADTKGVLNATITIIDDDGPTLKIKPEGTSLLEGSEGNVFTVSHNIVSDKDITVKVSSDKDEIMDYDHQVVIKAGTDSSSLMLNVKDNDSQDDGVIVNFKAEADGFSIGTCYIMLTDQTLPDAIVSLSADKTEVEAEQAVRLKAVVRNVGNSTLRSGVPVEIVFSGNKEKIKFSTDKPLEKGDSIVFDHLYDIPAITGDYEFVATVNPEKRIQELLYVNNSSDKVKMRLISPYTVTAQTDCNVYHQGEDIVIKGYVNGLIGKDYDVEVYIINDGVRQTLTAQTDEDGSYSVIWQPMSRQSGHFTIGACYPGEGLTDEMDAFDIYGLKTADRFITKELTHSETASGYIYIQNPCLIPQTGLKVTPKINSDNCEFSFSYPAQIGAGQSLPIEFKIKGNAISSGVDWQKMPIEITTEEGTRLDYSIYYYVNSLKARLETDNMSINTTMTLGSTREYPVTIRNVGKTETGKITFSLPDWIETSTPKEMASLAQGDSATVILRFIPKETMKLNVGISGQIGINCQNGDGTCVSFRVTPVSEDKGTLKIDVIDEYTYFTDEAPHVNNANVTITNPATGKIVAEGLTAYDGTFKTDLPEGWYNVSVEADKHNSYTNTIIVDPGVEKEEEVFLNYQAITYSWEVVETEVEDEYEFETIAKFETRVPKPVVIISLPKERPEPFSIVPVVVTNKGLVNALDVKLSLTAGNGFELGFLNEPSLDVLAPQQDHVFYAKLLPTNAEDRKRVDGDAPSSPLCFRLRADESHKDNCPKNKNREFSHAESHWGTCSNPNGGGVEYADDYNDDPGSPSRGKNNKYHHKESTDNVSDPVIDCYGTPYDNIPVEREGVSNELVPNSDCNEDPVITFKLVPVYGPRYEMLGVAADGVSQVRIVLDPKKSRIPSSDCKNFYDFNWKISNDKSGDIDPISDWEAIYTAPDSFPAGDRKSFTVDVIHSYWHGNERKSTVVKIEIVRPPVVFIHGLGDSDICWKAADEMLSGILGPYKEGYNYRVNYEETSTSTFMTNVGVVSDGIHMAQLQAKSLGYIASKCDLVGHSMGGILARLYVDRGGDSSIINRIITVNTPHAGSELGDIVTAHDKSLTPLAKWLYKNADIEAIKDLGVESDETHKLITLTSRSKIPVYSIATENNLYPLMIKGGEMAFEYINKAMLALGLLQAAGAIADPEPFSKTYLAVTAAMTLHSYVTNEAQHLFCDDYAQIGHGDLIVSSESQTGGCKANETIKGLLWHCTSPKDIKVIQRLKELLVSVPSDSVFSNEWFTPKKRNFEHNEALIAYNRIMSLCQIDELSLINDLGQAAIEDLKKNYEFFLNLTNLHQSKHSAPRTIDNEPAEKVERAVRMNLKLPESFDFVLGCVYLNDNLSYILTKDERDFAIPSYFSGKVSIKVLFKDYNGHLIYDEKSIDCDEPISTPVTLKAESLHVPNGKTRSLCVECSWDDGSKTLVAPDNIEIVDNHIVGYYEGRLKGLSVGETKAYIKYAGLSSEVSITVDPRNNYTAEVEEDSDSPCTSITLSFKQKSVMTRQAFRGTLTVNNGNESTPMKDFKLFLEVRDMDGKLATSREFQINPESIEGFKGDLDLTAGWTLGGSATGIANVIFIPTKYAAPNQPAEYSFGGSISYTDPYTGLTVTRQLNPVTLIVKPSPELNLTYFMQRDILGDDPLTEPIEPCEEAEFSLLIHNIGNGDATDIRMLTEQPQIIENEKGLLIDFEMVSSQLNGGEKDLALGSSVTTAFGDIKAKDTAYAQWWFKSSLLGHFFEYDVTASHVSSYDNPDLSLLNEVTVHELIRSLETERDGKKLIGFMTNDIADINDAPDRIYLTDGSIEDVYSAAGLKFTKLSDENYILSVTPSLHGWNYANIEDPTYGVSKIISIVRKSDGKEVSLRNVWQTDRTLRDGKDPLYENRIHFADYMLSSQSEEYEITFSPAPELMLEVAAIEGTPLEGKPIGSPITSLNVMFNKHIEPATFSAEDIEMSAQGNKIATTEISISTEDNKTFRLDLSKVDQSETGYYTITIKTANIVDAEGFAGKNGKTVGWSYYPDGKISISIEVYPENSGIVSQIINGTDTPVTPSSIVKAPYGESIILKAEPAEGYDFIEWSAIDKTYSTKEQIDFIAISNSGLTAEFTPKTYSVEVDPFCKGGSILGTSTGYYSFGEELSLVAVAEEGFMLQNWIVNGEETATDSTLTLTVKGETRISAVFEEGSGVGSITSQRRIVIHSIDGLLIDNNATLETIKRLEKGVYIINGVKYMIQ